MKSGQTAGSQRTGKCKVQGKKTDQVTGAETRTRGQGQKAGQITGGSSRKECWKLLHDTTVIQQRVCVEELVNKRLGDWLQLGGTSESDDVDQGMQAEWVSRLENQEWIVTGASFNEQRVLHH